MRNYSNIKEDNAHYDVAVSDELSIRLFAQDIDDILSAAFDSDSMGYWAAAVNVIGEGWTGFASEQIPRGYKLSFTLFNGNDTDPVGLDEFLNGIKIWGRNESDFFEPDGVFDISKVDGFTADRIVQYAVFGEPVY